MAGCYFSVLLPLLACVIWGAWLNCITTANQDTCGIIRYLKFLEPEKDHSLNGHVFLNLSIEARKQCEEECLRERECVSINIGPRINNMRACELSNSDHFLDQKGLKARIGWTYRGTLNLCATYPCHNNGRCYLGYTDKQYLCECPAGYTGENCEKDVNECKDGTHECHENANCTNIPGSFNCSCKKGYTGNGTLCSDVNECKDGTHDCHKNANCTNIPGSFNCSCKKGYTGNGSLCLVYKNCAELYKAGHRISGVHPIHPDNGGAFDVFCDQTTAGGGWTVFQKRLDGSVDFYRGWDDYKRGFGNLNGEFWLGLDKIHRLTKEQSRLRVDLEDTSGNTAYAEYSVFGVANEGNKYKLSVGTYSGTAGDSLTLHHGMAFSTKDRDNDIWTSNCAEHFKGAWWYKACYLSNLNGLYHHGNHSSNDGVTWDSWKGQYYSAKRAEMKIKPVNT